MDSTWNVLDTNTRTVLYVGTLNDCQRYWRIFGRERPCVIREAL
jgi:hypothetical protein